MTETPQENPFESPQTASDTTRDWPSKPYWTAVIFTVVGVLILLPLVPGLSIILALVMAPGLVRAHIRLRREYFATGQEANATQQFLGVMNSVFVCIPLMIASGIAFFVACFGGFIAAQAVDPGGFHDYGMTNLLRAGLPLGTIAGIVAFFFLFRRSLHQGVAPGERNLEKPSSHKKASRDE